MTNYVNLHFIEVTLQALRKRLTYAFLAIITITLGLLSRSPIIPAFIYPYLGDILYALLIYFLFAFLFARKAETAIALLALIFCVAIELSQLYHAPWIDNIRATKLGGLILGFGFLWSDLLAYAAGVSIGWLLEVCYLKPFATHR